MATKTKAAKGKRRPKPGELPKRRQARLIHFYDVIEEESGRIVRSYLEEAHAKAYLDARNRNATDQEKVSIEHRIACVMDNGFGYDVLKPDADLPKLEIGL